MLETVEMFLVKNYHGLEYFSMLFLQHNFVLGVHALWHEPLSNQQGHTVNVYTDFILCFGKQCMLLVFHRHSNMQLYFENKV